MSIGKQLGVVGKRRVPRHGLNVKEEEKRKALGRRGEGRMCLPLRG